MSPSREGNWFHEYYKSPLLVKFVLRSEHFLIYLLPLSFVRGIDRFCHIMIKLAMLTR